MLILISPAKTLDLTSTDISLTTEPKFKKETSELVTLMKKKSTTDLMRLMDISENLATLNAKRYKNFKKTFDSENSKQALLAFKGDVYTKMDVDNYSEEEFQFAQEHLRILSGLYGLLRPMDLIQPYRLEMGVKLNNKKGKNLYEFWGTRIAKAINKAAGSKPLINLASQEYFKAVDTDAFKNEIISPVFQEYKNGKYQIVGIYAKQARGMMTDYIIKNKITDSERLKLFCAEGYEWAGDENNWRFVR